MSRLRVAAFSISLDGFSAGPNQSEQSPLGEGGERLHQWMFPTRMFQRMYGKSEGTTGPDNDFAVRSFENIGAWILGRNMFGPVRGPWPDENWKGWWGEEPPYRTEVFVLTHHPRKSLEMKGGTTFHFVTEGIEATLGRARKAASGKDIRVGGGANTVRQYLQAGLIDEMHIAVSPVLLGKGEPLLNGIDLVSLGFQCREFVSTPAAAHYVLSK